MVSSKERWLIAAHDVLVEAKAFNEPVGKTITRMSRARKLGSKDRRLVREFVYQQLRKTPFPAWFVKRLVRDFKGQAADLIGSLRKRAKPVLAVDRSCLSAGKALEALQELGIEAIPSKMIDHALVVEREFSFDKLPENLAKSVWLMDEGSQVVAALIESKKGDKVLDLCAGLGGKTHYISQTKADITACDISKARLDRAKSRLGDKVQDYIVGDGLSAKHLKEKFDWILIDAPCSGTGTLRRHPDLIFRLSEEKVSEYVLLQKGLIKSAVDLLKPKGKLIYATCSILSEENQKIDRFVKNSCKDLRPFCLKQSLKDLLKAPVVAEENTLQLLPSIHGTDGFFVAAFQKDDLN